MAFVAAGGFWLAYRTMRLATHKMLKTVFVSLGIILIVLPIWGAVRLSGQGPVDWVYYTPERFDEAVKQRKIVLMEFTAEWCLNCKALRECSIQSQNYRSVCK